MESLFNKIDKFAKLPIYAMLVLVIFATLYILYDSNRSNQIVITNHLAHNTDALNGLTEATGKNTEVLRSLQIILLKK